MSDRTLDMYQDDIGSRPRLSRSDWECLMERLRNGDETARRDLVQSHLWLVVREARRWGWQGLDILDLIQEGNLGLLRAAKKFDPNRGAQFGTYAVFWIRKAFGQAQARAGLPVYLPESVFTGRFLRLVRQERELARELGFTPPWQLTILMTEHFSDRERGEFWYCWFRRLPLSAELRQKYKRLEMEAQAFLRCFPEILSLELEIPARFAEGYSFDQEPEEADLQLGDVIADHQQPEEEVEKKSLRQDMLQTLRQIPRLEREVLEHRSAIQEPGDETVKEFSRAHGYQHSRYYALERQALGRLRRPLMQQRVESYLDNDTRFADLHLVAGEVWNDADELPSSMDSCPDELLSDLRAILMKEQREGLKRWQEMSQAELMDELRLRLRPAGRQAHTLKDWVNDFISPGRSRRNDEDLPANLENEPELEFDRSSRNW